MVRRHGTPEIPDQSHFWQLVETGGCGAVNARWTVASRRIDRHVWSRSCGANQWGGRMARAFWTSNSCGLRTPESRGCEFINSSATSATSATSACVAAKGAACDRGSGLHCTVWAA